MTVQVQFSSWQTNPKQPDPKVCSPCCKQWWEFLRIRWGGANLGCYAKRPVVGGSSLSSHASGAALDWRYANPGPGRQELTRLILPWLLANSQELGLQAVHDYFGDRIWRPPGTSGRPAGPVGNGWKKQYGAGGQMGETWATWLHLEVHPSRWSDTRPVEEMIEPPPPPTEPPVEPPTDPPPASGVFTVQGYRKEVIAGSEGKMAKMCQQQINLLSGQGIAEDGNFGYQSVGALQNLQRVLGLTPDGRCGNQTWQAMENGIKVQTDAGDWD